MWQNLLTSDEIETESKNNWARNWAKIHETQKLSTNFACLGWKAGAQGGHKHRIVDTLVVFQRPAGTLCLLSARATADSFVYVFAVVQSPPKIIKQPPTDELLFQVKTRADDKDKPFIIECEADGEPAPE